MEIIANQTFERIIALASGAGELEQTIRYFSDCLKPIIKDGEAVLICFPRNKETDLGSIAEKAVTRCGGVPVFWEKDLRWKELLRLAFRTKASTIIATPLVLLGLTKLAAYKHVPMYFYNAVLGGYPCLDWMMDGIEKGLDCRLWGVYGPGTEALVTGFSCRFGQGIHIREDEYGVDIVDEDGKEVPDGQYGRIVLYPTHAPAERYATKDFAGFMPYRCPCGNPAPKLVGIDMEEHDTSSVMKITEELLYWSSILDCRISKTRYGLEIEVVCLAGEPLPKLPSCARLVVRPWDPETDCPFPPDRIWADI